MSSGHSEARSLAVLLAQLDPQAGLAERHLWLIALCAWLRGNAQSVPETLERLALLVDTVQAQPETCARLQAWWQALAGAVDITPLLADFGFAPRTALFSELAERLRLKLLPSSPETIDAAELFTLALPSPFDAQWLAALPDDLAQRLVGLLSDGPGLHARWQRTLLDAMTYCAGQILSTGFAPELRLRMSESAREAQPFAALIRDVESLRIEVLHSLRTPDRLEQAAQGLRERLDACRAAATTVYAHFEENGISVGLVFRLRQLRARSWRSRNTRPTEIPFSSKCAYTVVAAARQASSRSRRPCAACSSLSGVRRLCSTSMRRLSTSRISAAKGWASRADSLMRRRSSGAKPVERICPAQYVMASSRVRCQRACRPGPSDNSPTRRWARSSGRAASHCASNGLGRARVNSSAASMVSGLLGRSLRRRRSASSLNSAVRGAKPKSASSGVMSTAPASACHHACSRAQVSGWACTVSTSSASRSSVSGTLWALPRSQAHRAISHRWRSARPAWGSSCASRTARLRASLCPLLNATPSRSGAGGARRGPAPPAQTGRWGR